MGDSGALGRIGARALGWFVCASLTSLTIGLILVHLLQPGAGLHLALPPVTASAGLDESAFNLNNFFTHIVPASMIEAMATNEILQIVIFSVFVGVAINSVGAAAAPLIKAVDALVQVMLKITDYVMRTAPIAVFAAVASALAERGPGVIGNLAYFMGSVYIGLIVLWGVLIAAAFVVIGPRARTLLRYIREPLMLGFSTSF